MHASRSPGGLASACVTYSQVFKSCSAARITLWKASFSRAMAAEGSWSNLPAKMELVIKRLIFLEAPKVLWQHLEEAEST